jgi:transposase InsO family protein
MNIHPCAATCVAGRALLVRRVLKESWSVPEAAEAAGVSTSTTYKWLRRFHEEGEPGLRDRSSRPHRSPTQLPLEKADLIIELRTTKRMTSAKIAAVLHLARSTVARLLQRRGLARLPLLEPKTPVRRYEWEQPGDMLHVDVKKLGRIQVAGHRMHGDRTRRARHVGWEYVHVAVDDHSRLAYVEVLHDEKTATSISFLQRAHSWYARHGVHVQRLLTDNGTSYKNQYDDACAELGIWHLRTRAYTPRTNGKAERLIQTLLREWAYATSFEKSHERTTALRPWLRYYNRKRPHASLGGHPPISRLRAL